MRILTGLQPSGQLHLGNYFGSIKQMVEAQNEKANDIFVFVADWHALTTVREKSVLEKNILEVIKTYLACGLDPKRVTLYRQSDILEIQELAWILSTVAPMGLLKRAHSYKDKVAKGIEASVGLFYYPVLMAADILIMQSDVVPVGKDQKQHVEIARDLALKFHHQYAEVFTLPEPQIKTEIATVPGVDGDKMSKSYGNTIPLLAPPSEIEKLCKKVKTDSALPEDPKNPDEVVPYQLLKLVSPEVANQMLPKIQNGGLGYGEMKKILAEETEKCLRPIREKAESISDQEVELVLGEGGEKAKEVAQETLKKVRGVVGL